MSIWLVSLILIFVVFLLITERLPVDVTSIGIIVVLMITRLLPPLQAVLGFANPAVITVGAMFLISRGMIRTGAVGFVGQKVIQYSRGNPKLAMIVTLLMVAFASAFINNTPVVVLFIPIILSLSCEYNLSPSKFLIPISYASILAGTCTLIGTSTNIIVSDLSVMYGYGKIEMFELSSVGIPIALAGLVFLYFSAPLLMPGHAAPTCEIEDREDRRYLAELIVRPESRMIGRDPGAFFAENYPSFELFEMIRGSHIFHPNLDRLNIAANDLLLVKGSANDLLSILNKRMVELPHADEGLNFAATDKDSLIVELIIPPQSSLLGERLLDTHLQGDPNAHIIAIKRRHLHYSAQKIQTLKLSIGDIILVRCSKTKLDQIRREADFIIIEDVHHEIIHKQKARWAVLIFAGLIIAASTGMADIMVCALSGVLLMALTGCLQLRDAYRAIQGNVLLLIVGMIALGAAIEKTGATQFYAHSFLSLFKGASPSIVLAGIILLTSIGTQLLSNNAIAVLLLPVAISTAQSLGVNPKAFIVAVCFGASACFASPIGYQTNLLVYGPGNYRFSDYLKLGIPLNLLVIFMGSMLIPIFWPF
ncbi:SLC13 family permease [Thermodesulfobacteriota bacterium]